MRVHPLERKLVGSSVRQSLKVQKIPKRLAGTGVFRFLTQESLKSTGTPPLKRAEIPRLLG